jgi:multisubunit Na+/H+ antiporter MnhE subunit
MNELLLFIVSAIFLYLLSKRDFLNPATVYCAVAFGSTWIFYSCAILDYCPRRLEALAVYNANYSDVSVKLLLFQIVQSSIAVAAFTIAKRGAAKQTSQALFGIDLRNPLNCCEAGNLLGVQRLSGNTLSGRCWD